MGSATNTYADAAKRLAGRSVLAIGSGIAAGSRLVAKGVIALTVDTSDKEPVRFLKFAQLEWGGGGDTGGSGSSACATERLPVLLIGLGSGFQVWRLDGANPAELVSRRDGPTRLLEALPEPRVSDCTAGEDMLRGDRPLLTVVPAREDAVTPPSLGTAAGALPQGAGQQQQHSVQLYSLRSQGYVRTLAFSGEVLAVQASARLLVVALRGQLQAFDACTLQHTFSCLTYTPPTPLLLAPPGGSGHRQHQHQLFVTEGLTSTSTSNAGSEHLQHQHVATVGSPRAAATPPPAVLSPFALGPRWLAYAADTPVPQAGGQAVAQRLPLARHDSSGSSANGGSGANGGSKGVSWVLDGKGMQLGSSPSGGSGGIARTNGLTKGAVADAALQVAAKGGQQLKAGLAAAGSASLKYFSLQYQSWRQGQQQHRDVDAFEADAVVTGTVVVRDAASRQVVVHFRAHTSPLVALQFSPGGTILATASVAGHSINLFRIVPPPAAAASCAERLGGGTGHAVHLYRLYRGVTPAAIRDIAIAPDAAWVAASSARGTTHLFHTPAAAPGAWQQLPQAQVRQQQAPGAVASETGVVGQPPKTLAVGRARKPGLLRGGVTGAATSAARKLYAGQTADADPIAVTFLAGRPTSPQAAPGLASSTSLYVVTPDGLLMRHLLRAPPGQDQHPSAAAGGAAVAADGHSGGAARGAGGSPGMEGQDAAAALAAAAVLEEADRWDVARHGSWPEREELLPGPRSQLAAVQAAPAARGGGPPVEVAMAEQQQLWVAQAEPGALAAPNGVSAPPLWQDSQFRFYELQIRACQQRQPATAAAPSDAGALAGQMEAAAPLEDGPGGTRVWLESIPARPIQQL